MANKKTQNASTTTAPKGIPVTAATAKYVMGSRNEGTGTRLVEFLQAHPGEAFTEPMLAIEFGFERQGKPHQQRVNGPLRKVWDAMKEGKRPAGLEPGFELQVLSVSVGGRQQKAWAVVEQE